MSHHVGITDQIRALLREHGPLTVQELAEQTGHPRDNVAALVHQRRKAGELTVAIIDGKPTYRLVEGFQMACPQRKAHDSKVSLSPPAPSSAPEDAPTGPSPAVFESPAPPRTPVATTPHVAHAATPETPRKRPARAKPASELAQAINQAAARAAHAEPTRVHAIAALLRAIADLIDPPHTTGEHE